MSELMPRDEFSFTYDDVQVDVPEEFKHAKRIPKEFNRTTVAKAFHDAFELMGGVPRFTLWAHQNETDFYKLYAKLLPNAASQDFNSGSGERKVIHALKRTALDGEFTENGGETE